MYTKTSPRKYDTVFAVLYRLLLVVQLLMIFSLATDRVSLERFCSYSVLIAAFFVYAYSFVQHPFIKVQDLLLITLFVYLLFGL